jgi:hypothetical protein
VKENNYLIVPIGQTRLLPTDKEEKTCYPLLKSNLDE